MRVGYARVSRQDQRLEPQRDALLADGCERVFEEKISSREADRKALRAAFDYCREDDVLVVARLDRLGRSLRELIDLVLRTRVVPRCTAALLLLSWGTSLFAGGGLLVPSISTTLGSIGLGAIGVLVLRQSDSEWAEHAALTGELRVAQPESPAAGQQT